MTGLVGAIVEAWDELRIHKLRVLLSLVGVAVAVMAITGVTAAVQMLQQGYAEQADRGGGRQVTLQLNAWSQTAPGLGATAPDMDDEYARVLERYSITYASRDQWTTIAVRMPAGTEPVQMRAVDPDLATLYRIRTVSGRWFTDADSEAFAPQLVVNQTMLAELGVTDVASHPTVLLGTDTPVRATVIGVVPDDWTDVPPTAFLLYDQMTRWGLAGPDSAGQVPTLSLWVPADQVDGLKTAIRRDLSASLPGYQLDLYDNRDMYQSGLDDATKWIGIGVGTFALLLGGLGLVNISLVTVRHRIREIGIRRSFGATSARVFFGVLMESVVATVVAGFVGVALAVAILKAIPVDALFGGYGLQDVPPFPLSAALIGMAAATAVGALAGLIPAEVAVRVKVIDAIRY